MKNQKGLSLIEVIISMFLIFVLFVLYLAAMNVVALTKKTNYENIASHIASEQMEILRETPFDELPDSGTISNTLLSKIPSGAGSFTVADDRYKTGMKEIKVTVTWNDNSGSKQVTIQTLAGTGGINP